MGEKLEMRATTARQGIVTPGLDTTQQFQNLGSIDDVRAEVDDAHHDMRRFYEMEPDEVMRLVSGHLARLAELSKEIRRIEGTHRQWKVVRTSDVDPTMRDLMEQFQIHSRLQSVRELDWKVAGSNG